MVNLTQRSDFRYNQKDKSGWKEAYTTDYAKKALDALKDQDTKGANYKPINVALSEGGK